MDKIYGTNLGNWLVLEKWMSPDVFTGTGADDEVWLNRKLNSDELAVKMKKHRDEYITENDFKIIASKGMNLVRIPVPYFIFGDQPPFLGCIEYLDKAFDWAANTGLKILIDLHTVPGSQNGYDNGGLTGVCKWCKNVKNVEFTFRVLERLAKRYCTRDELFGIEILNEPISFPVYITAPSTGKAVDKAEAKGSGYVPMKFLKEFYKEIYVRLRAILPEDKVIVFHDGFRLRKWKNFFVKNNMKNVVLDTHIYVFAMESFVPIHKPWVYQIYINSQKRLIARAQKYTPVIVGEWCICNKYAEKMSSSFAMDDMKTERRDRYRQVHHMQKEAWSGALGNIYWNYKLNQDYLMPCDESWKESWDLRKCWASDWIEQSEGAADNEK